MQKLRERLMGTLFLSSMLHITDAKYCVRCGRGAGMVQLGALLAAASDQFTVERRKKPKLFLPDEEKTQYKLFKKELAAVRAGLPGTVTALNLAVFDMEAGLKAARAWERAGGEILELNVHGDWGGTSKKGFLRGMARPRYQSRLIEWVERLARETTLIVKFHGGIAVDFPALVSKLNGLGICGYHFNIGLKGKSPDFDFVAKVLPHCDGLFLVSGHIRSPGQVRRLLEMGVTAAGFSRPVLEDEDFILDMSRRLGEK